MARSRFDRIESENAIPEAIRVAISTRISVDRDTEQSIKNQMRECRAFAKLNGWEIVGEFVDKGKSAYKLETVRPGFDDAMAMIESGKANRLLVWKLDRMTRNARGFMQINDRLESMGATFASVKEPYFDTSTPIGLAIVMLMATMAQTEAEGIQGRALSWHEGRLGELMPPTGNRPYGYRRPNKGDEDWKAGGALIPVPDEVAIIHEMVARINAGESLRAIARDFTDRKIPTAQKNHKRETNTAWSHSTIRSVMLSPTTAGLVEVAKGEFVQSDKWEPIISEPVWRIIRAILTDGNRCTHIEGGKDARKLKHLLPGLMACGRCGGRMVTQSHKAGRQYGCADCELSIMADVADSVVTDWIMENVTVNQWNHLRAAGKGTDAIEELQGRINELFIERSLHPNRIPRHIYETTVAELESQIAAAQTDADIPMPDVANLGTGWVDMSNADRRTVIGGVIQSITVTPYCKGNTGRTRIVIEGKPIEG
jgi:DNA invertase Pin-like site-specific DNA recombinase